MTKHTPTEAMIKQISFLEAAISAIQKAIDDATGSTNPEEATWGDVGKLAMMVDQIKRAEVVQ